MPDKLDQFRNLTGRPHRRSGRLATPPIPPREIALVLLILANVAWLTYSLGGVRLWGISVALVLSLASLFLLPRWPVGEYNRGIKPVFRLLRCPLFWLGFGLYTYMFIQSWNLAWEWQIGADARPILTAATPLVSWLPTGLSSPLDENNPLRSMMFYTVPWITCSVLWSGLSSRRAIQFLLHGLAWLGILFAIIALWQHFLGMDRVLGIFPTVPSKLGYSIPFWGTLINENHAAFYLVLTTGLCLGLFLSGWSRHSGLLWKKGGIWMLYLACSLLTSYTALMAQARGPILCLMLLWILAIGVLSVAFVRRYGKSGIIIPATFFLLACIVVLGFVANPEIYDRQRREWIRTINLVENPQMEARYYLMQISLDMVADHPWLGQGSGCFRYLHLRKLSDYPGLRTYYYRWQKNKVTGKSERVKHTIWYQNAHVDFLEYLIDWGIVGCLFPLSILAWLLTSAIRSRIGMDPGRLLMLLSVLVVLLGAAFEYHLRIPLVLLGWSLVLVGIVRLCQLDADFRESIE